MCCSPRKVLQSVTSSSTPSSVGMDQEKFHSSAFQRVYQYLWQRSANKDLDQFVYEEKKIKHDCARCLQLLIEYVVIGSNAVSIKINVDYAAFRNCGVRDPSWSEINHFITFLDLQLKPCESDFFKPELIKDIMPGLKEFIVKFMIQMSRV